MRIPLAKPSLGVEEEQAVVEVLRSGWITTGPRTRQFEEAFRAHCNTRHALSFSSNTAALHALFHALDIGPGDEVITPSLTWCSVPNLILLAGARPIFVDVDEDTLNIDPDDVARVISDRTKAIIPVHFAGLAYDIDAVKAVIGDRPIPLIDDAAHALGTTLHNIQAGSFADFTVFSFHPIKAITTGEGGMIVHNDEAIQEKMKLFRFHGIQRDSQSRYSPVSWTTPSSSPV